MDPVRIMIVDDNINFIAKLSQYLNAQELIQVVAIALNRKQALLEVESKKIDIVLMEVVLNGSDEGIQAIGDIREISQNIKIIMVSSHNHEDYIRDGILAGANYYVLKGDYQKIVEAIRSAATNEKTPNQVIYEKLRSLHLKAMAYDLTPSEKQVLDLLIDGRTHREISQKLIKAESTVKKQVSSILLKFQVSSAKELIRRLKSIKLAI